MLTVCPVVQGDSSSDESSIVRPDSGMRDERVFQKTEID
ncbi:hypothetical protein QFZ82_007809 [Streptomyces sp. V4I23]|nr:hypothetical protein [Streptomyces sp. V4I23]